VCDGAQAPLPLNIDALDIDFYAFSGHKMLGPWAAACSWASRAARSCRHIRPAAT
jgi:cysteine desulfurase/selenocysteine lyase